MNKPRPTARSSAHHYKATNSRPNGHPSQPNGKAPSPPPPPPTRARDLSEFAAIGPIPGLIKYESYLSSLSPLYQIGVERPAVEICGIMEHGEIVQLKTHPRRHGAIPQIPVSCFDLENRANAALKEIVNQTRTEYAKKKQAAAATPSPAYARSVPAPSPLATASSS